MWKTKGNDEAASDQSCFDGGEVDLQPAAETLGENMHGTTYTPNRYWAHQVEPSKVGEFSLSFSIWFQTIYLHELGKPSLWPSHGQEGEVTDSKDNGHTGGVPAQPETQTVRAVS
jgi:hypothetical protein